MTKSELIDEMAKHFNTKKEAEAALESLIGAISEGLKKGEKITLTGFGTFKVAKRKARKGRNPQTGETIKIKAKKVPQFTAGSALKAAVA